MVALPIKCQDCGRERYHYGECDCVAGRLRAIASQRDHLAREIGRLNRLEMQLRGEKG